MIETACGPQQKRPHELSETKALFVAAGLFCRWWVSWWSTYVNIPKIWPQPEKKAKLGRHPQTPAKAVKLQTHFNWAPFSLVKDKVKMSPSWTVGHKFWGTKPMQIRYEAAVIYCQIWFIWNHEQKSKSIIFILLGFWVTAAIFKNKQN